MCVCVRLRVRVFVRKSAESFPRSNFVGGMFCKSEAAYAKALPTRDVLNVSPFAQPRVSCNPTMDRIQTGCEHTDCIRFLGPMLHSME